jgi:hypothetical protein
MEIGRRRCCEAAPEIGKRRESAYHIIRRGGLAPASIMHEVRSRKANAAHGLAVSMLQRNGMPLDAM